MALKSGNTADEEIPHTHRTGRAKPERVIHRQLSYYFLLDSQKNPRHWQSVCCPEVPGE